MTAASLVLFALLNRVGSMPGVPSDLPPEARPDNERGIADIEAGAYARGVEALERSYALMPDPLRHRVGRSKVLGSIRSALDRLYTLTGDPAYLRRLQRLILRHLEALLAALGDAATYEDSEPYLIGLWTIEDDLARLPATATDVAPLVTAVTPATPRVPAAPRQPPAPMRTVPPAPGRAVDESPSPRQLRLAGGVVLGLGIASLGAAVYGLVTQQVQRSRAREFEDMHGGPRITRVESDELHGYLVRARFGRGLAIGTGVVAGLATAVGTSLLVMARRSNRPRRWSAAPWWSTSGAGLIFQIQLRSAR